MYLSDMELYRIREISPGKYKVIQKLDKVHDAFISRVKSFGYHTLDDNEDVLIDYSHDIFREGSEDVCDVIETYKLSVKLKNFINE